MADPSTLAQLIWAHPTSRIGALNLLAGVYLGQLSEQQAGAICVWWAELAAQTKCAPNQVAKSLGGLCDLFEGILPAGFVRPSVPLPDPHIIDRRRGGLSTNQRGACVKEARLMNKWADTTAFRDRLINLASTDDQIGSSSDSLHEYKDERWHINIKSGLTITNPNYPTRSILFYTDSEAIAARINALRFEVWADEARDALGLVEQGRGANLVLIEFPSELAEARPDCGRPTGVDAGGYARFVSSNLVAAVRSDWGSTADLSQFTSSRVVGGLPERVCGPFPSPPSAGDTQVEVRLLGYVRLPRGDEAGKRDQEFADALLSCIAVLAPNINPTEKLGELMAAQVA